MFTCSPSLPVPFLTYLQAQSRVFVHSVHMTGSSFCCCFLSCHVWMLYINYTPDSDAIKLFSSPLSVLTSPYIWLRRSLLYLPVESTAQTKLQWAPVRLRHAVECTVGGYALSCDGPCHGYTTRCDATK